MVKWMVAVDHESGRSKTVFDHERDAWALAELLDRQGLFDGVYVRRITFPDDPLPVDRSADVEHS